MIRIKRGLDIPISGAPEQQQIVDGPSITTVAVTAGTYIGLKPTMLVEQGDKVKLGQALFTDKKNPGVKFVAPAAGTVSLIHRGAKRVFHSLVINVEGNASENFPSLDAEKIRSLSREALQEYFVDTGSWTFFRSRPYGKIPALDSKPVAIFVNAMDSNPLAANPEPIILQAKEAFELALLAISRLTEGKTYLCTQANSQLPDFSQFVGAALQTESFAGPHPAGLSGTHVHFLSPVSEKKQVWTINYQQAIAIGRLLQSGKISQERVIALVGPQVEKPCLIRTQLGASTDELCAGRLKGGENRIIIGSVLSGSIAAGAFAYLDDTATQVSVIAAKPPREFVALVGHVSPHLNRHSVKNLFLSKLNKNKKFDMTATLNGSTRAMVPIGSYEEVMPLDILPTQLLRSILVGDTETAIALGALELVEEDLALCTYVCPGKYEYGPILRDNLTSIEVDG